MKGIEDCTNDCVKITIVLQELNEGSSFWRCTNLILIIEI